MTPFLGSIVERILNLPAWAALAFVFALPALEASAFLGFVFPGEIAIFLGGVLAFQGRISLGAAIAAAILGAFIGDNIGYFVGRKYGRRILHSTVGRLPIIRNVLERHLDTAEAYLKRKGGRAVFFGRFTAALRVMVPGLAGMARMRYPKFLGWNLAGGALWGTGFVLLGYAAGEAWRKVEGYAGYLGLVLLGIIVGVLITTKVVRARRRARAEGAPSIGSKLAGARPIAWMRRTYPRTSGWLWRRLSPSSPGGFPLTFVVVAGAFCWLAFALLTQDVVVHQDLSKLDPKVTRFVVEHRESVWNVVMKVVTWLGSSAVLIPLIVVVGAAFLIRARDWRPGVALLAGYLGALGTRAIVKAAVERPRPPLRDMLVHATGSAFPSGHACNAVAVYGTLAAVLWAGRPFSRKAVLWVGAGLIAVVVGFSRLYLGVHWLTDVLGGLALGGAWLAVLLAVMLALASRRRATQPAPVGP